MDFKGTITALITPFKGEEIDEKGFRQNIRYQISEGINGIVVLGSTGESASLSEKEKEKLVSIAVEEAKGKITVIVGTGHNDTRHTIQNTRLAKDLGADGALVITPYYNKPTQEGIYKHFKAITDKVDLPLLLYNHQGRTGTNIETSTLLRIAHLQNILGVKDASGSIDQAGDVIHEVISKYPDFIVLSGNDNLIFPLIALGAHGVISSISNLIPAPIVKLVQLSLEGDMKGARDLHYQLLHLFTATSLETNPLPIKAAMNIYGMPSGGYRLPLCEMLPGNLAKLNKILINHPMLQECGR